MNLDKQWFQAKAKYESALRVRGLNAKATKQLHREFVAITNRILRRDKRKSA